MPLFAPLAVPIEIRAADRRVFRLSYNIADTGITLERPAPFEIGQPVTVGFTLPDDFASTTLVLRAIVALTDSDGDGADGGCAVEFIDTRRDDRQVIMRYVLGRLGLPGGAPRQ